MQRLYLRRSHPLFAFLMAILAWSCDSQLQPSELGALALSFSGETSVATVDNWRVTISGPSGSQSLSGSPGTTLSIRELAPGQYGVTLQGFEVGELVQQGTTSVSVSAGAMASASVSLTTVPRAVASVSVALGSTALTVGQTAQATATLRDASGNVLTGRSVTWNSTNTAVATVNATSGVVTAVGEGGAMIQATSEGYTGRSATLTVSSTITLADFSLVPAGTFRMGSANGYSDEQPVHSVTITRPFYLQKTEVTQGQWQAVMRSNPSGFTGCGPTCPVESVSWDDIQLFLTRLNQANPGITYRLPTEAEWEYGARAGTTGDYGGTGVLNDMGWYDANSGGTTRPVAQKTPNAWGLYDMHGNVWEWVQDWYSGSYYAGSPAQDPPGPSSGSLRVLRGGSWLFTAFYARSAIRYYYTPSFRVSYYGFRLARTP